MENIKIIEVSFTKMLDRKNNEQIDTLVLTFGKVKRF